MADYYDDDIPYEEVAPKSVFLDSFGNTINKKKPDEDIKLKMMREEARKRREEKMKSVTEEEVAEPKSKKDKKPLTLEELRQKEITKGKLTRKERMLMEQLEKDEKENGGSRGNIANLSANNDPLSGLGDLHLDEQRPNPEDEKVRRNIHDI